MHLDVMHLRSQWKSVKAHKIYLLAARNMQKQNACTGWCHIKGDSKPGELEYIHRLAIMMLKSATIGYTVILC